MCTICAEIHPKNVAKGRIFTYLEDPGIPDTQMTLVLIGVVFGCFGGVFWLEIESTNSLGFLVVCMDGCFTSKNAKNCDDWVVVSNGHFLWLPLSPRKIGENFNSIWLPHVFQMGWFNQQLDEHVPALLELTRESTRRKTWISRFLFEPKMPRFLTPKK